MKLRSLAVNQFKKFASPTLLEEIQDGLNVVAGPNEMGKSTLLGALRAVLFERYSSKAQPITALQNDRNQAGPVVQLGFELDNGAYKITKRFLKKPYARLLCPDGRTLEGDAAEEELRRLLDFDAPGNKGAQPETLGMWDVLWVQQGQSISGLDIPQRARSNLHNVLESEVGAVLGGRRGRALPQAVETQLHDLVDRRGKPCGPYEELIERGDSLRNEIDDLKTRRRDLSQTLDDLEEAQRTLERLASDEQDRKDRQELDGARERYRQLSELETQIAAASTQLELRKHKLEQAEHDATDRQRLKEDSETAKQAFDETEKRLTETQGQERDAQSRFDELRTGVGKAEAAVAEADRALSRERRVLDLVKRQASIRELEERREKAVSAEARRNEAILKARSIRATDGTIAAVRRAKQEMENVASRLDAAATRISFDMAPERLSGVEIDGRPLSHDLRSVKAVEPATIAIPERGQITIEPAIRDRDSLLRQRREAETAFTEALEGVGASTAEDAENQYDERRDLLQAAELARKEAVLFAPATEDRDEGAEALAVDIDGQRGVLDRDMEELGLQRLPTRPEAETALRKDEEQANEARRALDTVRAEMAGPEEVLKRFQTELATAKARHQEASKRLEDLRRRLHRAEGERPNEELLTAIGTARTAQAEQERVVAQFEAQRGEETLEQLQTRTNRLENAIQGRKNKRDTLIVEIAKLKSLVEAVEGAGLDQVIEEKNRDMELYTEERTRLSHEVDVLRLLLSTLRTAEREAKERYLSPVLDRVRPHLGFLFPGADMRIDENFGIVGVTRQTGYEESFDHLSMGAQEQITVLVRLAFADMLMEQGRPATIVLDDALVFSDDQRMSRMFDILNRVSQKIQIVVFTCREELFEKLGAKQLTLRTADEEELRSA